MPVEFLKNNRKKLSNLLNDHSMVVLFAGKAPFKAGDQKYQFSPNRNMYYMTEVEKENSIFVMYKENSNVVENLYIERQDELKEKWIGKDITNDELKKQTGIKNIKYLDEFDDDISVIIFLNRIEKVLLDMEKRSIEYFSPSIEFANRIKNSYPYIEIKDIYPKLAEFRLVKNKAEIERIKYAIDITSFAIQNLVFSMRPNIHEYVLQAYFEFTLKSNGIRETAFPSIVASGKNATILHYTENNAIINDGDLVLVDLGAQYKLYNSDITRTFPVNGKFTDRQKLLYNIVLGGQEKVFEAIRPGVEFDSLNEILKEYYFIELNKIGLIGKNKSQVDKYYYHKVSHFLGLETHDGIRNYKGKLKIGMILTIEPGLYIEEENIGIRIEDDVIVTRNGCEILSDGVPKTVSDIEEFIVHVKS